MVLQLFKRLLQPFLRMPYYAVRAGRKPGIYTSWDECKKQVDKFPAPKFKKFSTEAEAASFIKGEATSSTKPAESDAGKVKKTKTVSSQRQKTPYSRPTDVSSSNWSQNKTTKLISPEETRQIHTSSGNSGADKSGSGELKDGAIVYTDGACHNNGMNNPCAGIGVYWGPDHPLNVSERLAGRQTNNRAEIHAVVCAAKQARQKGLKELTVKTDSQFLINSMTKWLKGWQKKGWVTSAGKEVINREDFEDLVKASEGLEITYVHVKGHDGEEGNECADKLAVQGTKKTATK